MNILTASHAHLWAACAGSVRLASQVGRIERPDRDDTTRREGLTFHDLAEKYHGGFDISKMVGTISVHDVLISDEMISHVIEYVEGLPKGVTLEDRVSVASTIPVASSRGIVDAWVFDGSNLHVIDAKYGHRYVDHVDNWQLIIYTRALRDQLGIDGYADQNITVHHTIYQPRCYSSSDGPWRTVTYNLADLRAQFNFIQQRAVVAGSDDHSVVSTCNVGAHCTHCPARYACKTLGRSVMSAWDYAADSDLDVLTVDQLAVEIQMLRDAKTLLDARLDIAETRAESLIHSGDVVPGWTIERKPGRAVWSKSTNIDDVRMLGELYSVDVNKPVELKTPTQLIKLGIDETVIAGYSERPPGKARLVKFDSEKMKDTFTQE